jgi:hypothetical protein
MSTNVYPRAERHRGRLNEFRSKPGSPLLRRTLRHYNAEVRGSLSKQARLDIWLDTVTMHTHNEEMMDPDTNDEVLEDLLAEHSLQSRSDSEKLWIDGEQWVVSRREASSMRESR